MNPLQMLGAMKNPQAFIQQMMNNSQVMRNPMAKNIIDMAQKGDVAGIEQMGRNIAKERGTTVDDMKSQIMAQFGMK